MEEFRHSLGDSNMYTTLITTASLIACVTTQLVVKGKFYATCDPLPRDAVDGEVLWWLLFAIPLGLFAAYVPVVFSEAVLYLRARLRRVGIVKQMIFSGLMTTLLGTLCYEVTRLLLTEKELCPKQNSCAAPTTGRLMLELSDPIGLTSAIFGADAGVGGTGASSTSRLKSEASDAANGRPPSLLNSESHATDDGASWSGLARDTQKQNAPLGSTRKLAADWLPSCGWDGVWGAGGRTMSEILKPRQRLLQDESLLAPLLVCSIIFFACKFIACLTAVACGGK